MKSKTLNVLTAESDAVISDVTIYLKSGKSLEIETVNGAESLFQIIERLKAFNASVLTVFTGCGFDHVNISEIEFIEEELPSGQTIKIPVS